MSETPDHPNLGRMKRFALYVLIIAIIVAYVIHIPFAVRSKRWAAAHPETWDKKPQQRRAQRRATRRATHPHRRSMARLGLRRPQR